MSKVDHEINSYNSLILNQTNKNNLKFSKTYSSSKLLNPADIASLKNNNKLLSDKIDNNNAKLNCFNTDNTLNKNMKNINRQPSEEKESSSKNVKKLPKILKYTIQTNSAIDSKCDNLSINKVKGIISMSNPTDKKRKENINNNSNNFYSRKNIIFKEEFKEKISSQIDRTNSLKLSETNNLDCIKKMITPSDQIKNKKAKIKKEINFGKMKDYIKLSDFLGDEPLTEMTFNPIIDDNLTKPQNEKQYEFNLYLNSHKMLTNLIYLKVPLNKDGTIPIENIINVKKIKSENKSEDEEELAPEKEKEKSDPAPPANADENLNLIIPKKRFISISEYPGNYNKPEKEILNEKQLKFSQNMDNIISNVFDSSEKIYSNDSELIFAKYG